MGTRNVVPSLCLVDQRGNVVDVLDCIPDMVYTRYASLCLLSICAISSRSVMGVDGRICCARSGGWSL